MYEILLRIVDIIEDGTYGGESLGSLHDTDFVMKALRLIPPSIAGMPKPLCIPMLRQTTEYVPMAGDYQETQAELVIDLRFYLADIGGKDALNYIQMSKYSLLATQLFLSRPQLQHNDNGIIYGGSIRWQITSDLSNPLFYPFNAPQDVAIPYWGFQARLTIPHTLGITSYPAGA
jgi:hypothetical protein